MTHALTVSAARCTARVVARRLARLYKREELLLIAKRAATELGGAPAPALLLPGEAGRAAAVEGLAGVTCGVISRWRREECTRTATLAVAGLPGVRARRLRNVTVDSGGLTLAFPRISVPLSGARRTRAEKPPSGVAALVYSDVPLGSGVLRRDGTVAFGSTVLPASVLVFDVSTAVLPRRARVDTVIVDGGGVAGYGVGGALVVLRRVERGARIYRLVEPASIKKIIASVSSVAAVIFARSERAYIPALLEGYTQTSIEPLATIDWTHNAARLDPPITRIVAAPRSTVLENDKGRTLVLTRIHTRLTTSTETNTYAVVIGGDADRLARETAKLGVIQLQRCGDELCVSGYRAI